MDEIRRAIYVWQTGEGKVTEKDHDERHPPDRKLPFIWRAYRVGSGSEQFADFYIGISRRPGDAEQFEILPGDQNAPLERDCLEAARAVIKQKRSWRAVEQAIAKALGVPRVYRPNEYPAVEQVIATHRSTVK